MIKIQKYINIFRSLLLVLLVAFTPASHADSAASYTFYVVPQYKPTQLHKEWTPLLERISRETGIKLKLELAPSILRFESELTNGIPDFAYMNPYQEVIAMKSNGYIPILRDKKSLSGILVVRKDSPYKTPKDLDGKVIGFPSPNAFGASLYMRALLTEQVGIKFTPRYLNNHTLVFRHVALGHVEAGGSINSALNDEAKDTQSQLTILFKTPEVASHPISVNPRVPASVRKSVINALLGMAQDAEGRAMLNDVRLSNLIDTNYQNDYQPLEKLNLQKYLVQENE